MVSIADYGLHFDLQAHGIQHCADSCQLKQSCEGFSRCQERRVDTLEKFYDFHQRQQE